jgi:CDP-glycerol glycerophosphotransferase
MEGVSTSRIKGMYINMRRKILVALDDTIGEFVRKMISRTTPVDGKTIMFMTFNRDYMCNPKYIAEELIRMGVPYRLVWAVDKTTDLTKFPKEIVTVKNGSLRCFKEMAAAKIWVDNALGFIWRYLPKKNGQKYIVTWHGSLGLKRISKDALEHQVRWIRAAQRCVPETDYIISNSEFEDGVYAGAHWPGVPILRYGHARNDIMFWEQDRIADIRRKVFSHYGIEAGSKILLYAPTYRNDENMDVFDVDYGRLVAALEQRFGGRWSVLVRHHFHVKSGVHIDEKVKDRVYVAKDWMDIQELMVVADAGMTDYSSWIFDFMLLRRPGFIFAADLDQYNNERGFYYKIETTPFPIAVDHVSLTNNIIAFDEDAYKMKVEEFLFDKGCVDDGLASHRAAEKIISIMSDGDKSGDKD